ncbi:MFS transporter [Lacticaseibacillus sp. N501-2]|uniref:MFS transporter n=1 Tax=Lacticaseibacillus salsurae TaxID=3367729 RepID=UPI0038B414D7
MEEQTRPHKRFYKHAPVSWVHLKIYLAIILGQFVCGYAIQISGTAITAAQKVMPISDLWIGLIGAGTLIGLAGSLLVGKLSDRIGRRRLLLVNMYILVGVSLLQLLTSNLLLTFILRVLVGLMVAVDYTAGNTLLIEWLPSKVAGRTQSRLVIYWTIGFIAASLIGPLFPTWQLMMASPAIFGLITAVFRSVVKLPTSPSWLVNQGKPKAAQRVITKHLGRKWGLSKRQKVAAQTPNESFKWTVVFSKKYLRQTAVGGVFYASQSFTFFGISIFLPILAKGMGIGDPSTVSTLYNGAMLLGVLLGIVVFNHVSRRQFLVADFGIAGVALLTLAFGKNLPGAVSLTMFSVFAVILSAGLVADYPYTSELFDSSVRGTGVGMVVTMSRFGAAAGTFLLPIITNAFKVQTAMGLCGVILVFACVVCFAFAPETSAKILHARAAAHHA